MIEVAIENDKPVRIGVNWGSLDQSLLTRLMDENSQARRAQRCARRHHGSHGAECITFRRSGSELRDAQRADHSQRKSQRRAGPDRRLSRTGAALRISTAPGADRSRHGRQRNRQQCRSFRRRFAGRHRRHHSRVADARPQRRSHGRSYGRPTDSAVHGNSQLHARR